MRKSDKLYFRRNYAQSKIKLETKVSKDGKRIIPASSLNAEKLADCMRHFLQNKTDYGEFKYDRLEELARKELEPAFERLGFNKKDLTFDEKKTVDQKKRIAISNWQEQYIKDNFPSTLRVDFDEFMKETNIKAAANGIKSALKVLISAQNSNFYEIEHNRVDLKTGEISTGISRVSSLPSITLWLDESLANKGYTLTSFAEAKIKNKRKYIKGLEIEFSPIYLYHILSIGSDYVTSFKSKRDSFKHRASHKLDILLNSLYGIQHNKSVLTFELEEIMELIGVSPNTSYKYFKRDILNPCLQDLEEYSGKKVKIEELREGKSVRAISFSIEKTESDDFTSFLYHYISSQLYYFSKIKINSIKNFKDFLENGNFPDSEEIGGKTLYDWSNEAESEYVAENDILAWLEDDEIFFKKNNIIYDKKKHTILKEKSDEVDGNEVKKYEYIYSGDVKLTTPTSSYRYLMSLEQESIKNSVHLADMIPFGYADNKTRKWINVSTLEVLIQNKEAIYKDIVLKNRDKFTFDTPEQTEMFLYYLEKELFGDINSSVKKRVASLFD